MVRVRYLWLSGWHCRPDFFLSRRFHQQPHSGFRSFCHRLSCKTAREHFLWFCRRLGGTRPRAENIAHHDGSANGTDWLLANLYPCGCAGSCFIACLKISAGIRDGGELPLNGCYVFEASPAHHRSVLCSMVMVSIALGMLLASLVANLLFWYFDRETIVQWAWRLPFLLSIPLTFFIIAMRRAIHDFPVPSTKLEGRSIATSCAVLKKPMLTSVSIMSFATVFGFVLTIWLPSYLNHFLN